MTRNRPALVVLAALALVAPGPVAAAAGPSGTGDEARATVTVELEGVPSEDLDATNPLVLDPDRDLKAVVVIRNDSTQDLVVDRLRLEGRVLGVPFLRYGSRVEQVVAPGESIDVAYEFDVSDLHESATGLLPAQVTVLDDARIPVAEPAPVVVDARGPLTSAYGMFGVLVALMTAMLLVAALVRLAQGTLPENRWYRAVRFAVPGVGLGLTATVTLSVFRVLVPSTGNWLTIVVCCGLAGLVLGFLTPTPQPARRASTYRAPAHALPPRHARGVGVAADEDENQGAPAPQDDVTVGAGWVGLPDDTAEAPQDVRPAQRYASGADEQLLPGPRTGAER